MNKIKLEIEDFLGFVDMNGEDALDSDQVERLENYIYECNSAMAKNETPLVVDAIYDRLVDILKKANPDAKVLKEVWSEDEVSLEEFNSNDYFKFLRVEPMRSINTVKSYDCDELNQFISRLPDGEFDIHASTKLNGHGIRLVYSYGKLVDATSRARNSAGHNIFKQLQVVTKKMGIDYLEDLNELDIVEIRGELCLPFENVETARTYNPNIVSAFTGVASMLRDSATEEEWGLLDFVAYKIIADGFTFETKEEEYQQLEDLGFKVPMYWVIQKLTRDNIREELVNIIADCEADVKPENPGEINYEYYTDGIVVEVNNRELFKSMGANGNKYYFGNVAMKVGYWQQDMYSGVVQTILWTRGKMKYSPVAIIAESEDMIRFKDTDDMYSYINDLSQIENYKELGVITAGGNRVRKVPLYEPNNVLMLDAYIGNNLFFRYGGEAGVVPCFEDGTPLIKGKINKMLEDDSDEYEEYVDVD